MSFDVKEIERRCKEIFDYINGIVEVDEDGFGIEFIKDSKTCIYPEDIAKIEDEFAVEFQSISTHGDNGLILCFEN